MLLTSKKLQTLGLALTIGLAACSDSNGPGNGEFDAPATTAELTAVDATFETPAYQSLAALGQYFQNGPVAMASASAALLEAQQQNASASMSDRAIQNAPQLSANLSAAPIPRLQEHYGTEFVYDVLEGKYVANPGGTAPADGIRVILYAVDPITHDIVTEPDLVPVGYVEIRDLNPASSAEIAVQVTVVSQGVTYTDYTVSLSLGAAIGNGASVNAKGFLTDGTTRADFDLTHTASFDFEGTTVVIDYRVEVAERNFAIDVDMTVRENQGNTTTEIDVLVTNGRNWVRITGTGENDVGNLEVRIGSGDGEGQLFATITTSPTGIEVLGGDGKPLSEEDAQALRHIWRVVEEAFDVFDQLFKPVKWLFEN